LRFFLQTLTSLSPQKMRLAAHWQHDKFFDEFVTYHDFTTMGP
jgi:hypothetical protein